MKTKWFASVAVIMSAILISFAPEQAAARGGGHGGGGFHGGGFYFGVGPYWGPYYPYYYGYPSIYSTPAVTAPQTYIQQSPPQEPPAPTYWYYCESSRSYYPYVQQCPGGWLTVAPRPGTEPAR